MFASTLVEPTSKFEVGEGGESSGKLSVALE